MKYEEICESAEAVAAELITVVGSPDMAEVRAAVVHAVISERMLPSDGTATIHEGLEHAGIVLSVVSLALGKAFDELEALDPSDSIGGEHHG